MKLIIVTPTYNEADNLSRLISGLFALSINNLGILIVDDNSPDGTGIIADDLAKKYPDQISVLHRSGKKGLGTAYISGFKQALDMGAGAVAQMDADLSHPPELLLPLLDCLAGCDVAMGSRYIPGGSVDIRWPIWRKLLSEFGNIYARSILDLPVKDATGGYKIWRREALSGMPLDDVRSNGYAFQIEMTYLANRLGYTFREIPFYFPDRISGNSKMSFRIQWEAAVRVWQMRFQYRHL